MSRPYAASGRPSFPRIYQIALGILVGGAYALLILQFQRPATRIPEMYEVSVEVGSADGTAQPGQTGASSPDIVIGMNNAVLYLPYDAISAAGTVSMIAHRPNAFTVVGEEDWNRPIVVDIVFRDKAGTVNDHLNLLKPAQLCFVLSVEGWQAYRQSPRDFDVQYYADEANPPRWDPLPLTAVPERNQLCGETTHLSTFALAVRKTIVIPVTGPTPMIYEVEPSATPTQTLLSTPTPFASGTHDPRNTLTPTPTPLPTSTPTPLPTNTHTPTFTPLPTWTPTSTVTPLPTPTHTPTPLPTDTPVPTPTDTDIPPTPTDTDIPPTPTDTDVPPTNTDVPPTNTDVPPTDTSEPPTTEPPPPTDPPVTDPPVTDPPATDPPATDPPALSGPERQTSILASVLSGVLFLSAGWLSRRPT